MVRVGLQAKKLQLEPKMLPRVAYIPLFTIFWQTNSWSVKMWTAWSTRGLVSSPTATF